MLACLGCHTCHYFIFPLQLEDVPGNDEITLSRTFGNEKFVISNNYSIRAFFMFMTCSLRLMFSIVEMPTEEEDFTSNEEGSGAREGEDEESLHSYPIRAVLSITKVGVSVRLFSNTPMT